MQAALEDPIVMPRKLARLKLGQQRVSELRVERNRFLRGLRFAAADNTEND